MDLKTGLIEYLKANPNIWFNKYDLKCVLGGNYNSIYRIMEKLECEDYHFKHKLIEVEKETYNILGVKRKIKYCLKHFCYCTGDINDVI